MRMVLPMAEKCRSSKFWAAIGLALAVTACTVNPATGDKQFTALMPAGQESKIGAGEHPKIIAQYGGPFQDQAVESYVNRVGQKVAANTERSDVTYKFFVLDTPSVNAFAMPGGYVYVTRGLLTLANDEAELAGVLAHEIGHITARHSAERYSQSVLAGLGLAVLSAAVNDTGVSRAAGLGSELVIKSYSRTQEYQADELGIRYLSRAGYDPQAMADFLRALDAHSTLERTLAKREGGAAPTFSYFSTHPQTEDRVARAQALAGAYPPSNARGEETYLHTIEGVTYGESARMGFVRGQRFIHPDLGFVLDFPKDFTIDNQPDKVVAASDDGVGVIFDAARNGPQLDPVRYVQEWVGTDRLTGVQPITVHGMRGAAGTLVGQVNGRSANVQVVAVEWAAGKMFRFQIALPPGTDRHLDALRRMAYSLRPITPDERAGVAALRIVLVTAKPGQTVETLARQMNLQDPRDDAVARFRVLNGMRANEPVYVDRVYKIVR